MSAEGRILLTDHSSGTRDVPDLVGFLLACLAPERQDDGRAIVSGIVGRLYTAIEEAHETTREALELARRAAAQADEPNADVVSVARVAKAQGIVQGRAEGIAIGRAEAAKVAAGSQVAHLEVVRSEDGSGIDRVVEHHRDGSTLVKKVTRGDDGRVVSISVEATG
jgi:hypothetical protein